MILPRDNPPSPPPPALPSAIVDLRADPAPQLALARLKQSLGSTLIWGEGDAAFDAVTRTHLRPADTLIVWTAPPDPETWAHALALVQPRRLVLFCVPVEQPTLQVFLRQISGMLQHVIQARSGHTSLHELAAASGQRTEAVRLALQWYMLNGRISLGIGEDGTVIAEETTPGAVRSETISEVEQRLRAVLEDTANYRRTFRHQQHAPAG